MASPFENFRLDIEKVLNPPHFLTSNGGIGDNRIVEKSASHTHAVFVEVDDFFAESADHVASSPDNSLHQSVDPVDGFVQSVIEACAEYCELPGVVPESRLVSCGETAHPPRGEFNCKPHEVFGHLTLLVTKLKNYSIQK
jgi:hypothetical protein